jgi:uncharacterized protein (TIGR02453 family)
MLNSATLQFLHQLSLNNNKGWFDEHRDRYITAKADFENLVSRMLGVLSTVEPALIDQKPKDCIFRIFRDVRFSKDKTPYKDHFGAYFSKGGRKFPGAGYYIHIQPGGKSFAGGGLWHPEPSLLKAVRQEIDYSFSEFRELLNDKTFRKYFRQLEGEALKGVPQGYDPENPAAVFLKMKSFTVTHTFTDEEVMQTNFCTKAATVFKAMRPLVDFLNRSMD